jgi:hypothetical protein
MGMGHPTNAQVWGPVCTIAPEIESLPPGGPEIEMLPTRLNPRGSQVTEYEGYPRRS